jgi:hypothetical protein
MPLSQSPPDQPADLFAEAIQIGVLNTQVGFLKQYGITAIQGLKLGIAYATEDTWQVDGRALQPMYIVEMVSTPDLDRPWAIPRLIREMSAEETAPPLATVA